jgi:hypothetical protein
LYGDAMQGEAPARRESAGRHCAYSVVRETINDITGWVLYDDGRYPVLWPVIFAKIVDSFPRILNRVSVAREHHAFRVINLVVVVFEDEEVAGHLIPFEASVVPS